MYYINENRMSREILYLLLRCQPTYLFENIMILILQSVKAIFSKYLNWIPSIHFRFLNTQILYLTAFHFNPLCLANDFVRALKAVNLYHNFVLIFLSD
jgi:hypothetical protein